MFGLLAAGILTALCVSAASKFFVWRDSPTPPFMLELPDYKLPRPRSIAIGLYTRAKMFLHRAGTTIFSMMVLIWFPGFLPATAGRSNRPRNRLQPGGVVWTSSRARVAPIGFNWQINVALIPGMAAREVAVAALGTVYAIEGGKEAAPQIGQALAQHWSMATALSVLVWYIFAPQCASTLAVIRRETGSWRFMALTFGYMLCLAYLGSLLTYKIALLLGAG